MGQQSRFIEFKPEFLNTMFIDFKIKQIDIYYALEFISVRDIEAILSGIDEYWYFTGDITECERGEARKNFLSDVCNMALCRLDHMMSLIQKQKLIRYVNTQLDKLSNPELITKLRMKLNRQEYHCQFIMSEINESLKLGEQLTNTDLDALNNCRNEILNLMVNHIGISLSSISYFGFSWYQI